MNTVEINNYLCVVKGYGGCYPCDKIPHVQTGQKPVFFVVNTDLSNNKGEHWVGLALYKKECLFYDSFGIKIVNKHILDYLRKMKYKFYTYSDLCVQPIYSDKCGYYVIAFILCLSFEHNYSNFIEMINEDHVDKNDELCINYINYIYDKYFRLKKKFK